MASSKLIGMDSIGYKKMQEEAPTSQNNYQDRRYRTRGTYLTKVSGLGRTLTIHYFLKFHSTYQSKRPGSNTQLLKYFLKFPTTYQSKQLEWNTNLLKHFLKFPTTYQSKRPRSNTQLLKYFLKFLITYQSKRPRSNAQLLKYWLNYSFGPSICHEILVSSSSFSLSQFGPHR